MNLTRCPVCRARLRDAPDCQRCGADLGQVLQVANRACRLEQIAARQLVRGEHEAAMASLVEAQRFQRTPMSIAMLQFLEERRSGAESSADVELADTSMPDLMIDLYG